MIRLCKLIRLVRLLEGDQFKDLFNMVHGMLGGSTTLYWATLLFFLAIYVVALVFRETLGRKAYPHIYGSFRTVPKALFTTFRCSFGDCNDEEGYPIFEHVALKYGMWHTLFFCIFTFAITIGLFNVIAAMFVESTVSTAVALNKKRANERLQDKKLWANQIYIIIRKLLELHHREQGEEEDDKPSKLSDRAGEIMKLSVDRAIVDDLVQKPEIKLALDELGINRNDHKHLSDILDPDNT